MGCGREKFEKKKGGGKIVIYWKRWQSKIKEESRSAYEVGERKRSVGTRPLQSPVVVGSPNMKFKNVFFCTEKKENIFLKIRQTLSW